MWKLILKIFFLNIFFTQPVIADQVPLTTSIILHSFPICAISGSLFCQTLGDAERVNSSPQKITDHSLDLINEERLEISTDDWYYTFLLEVISKNTATIELVDQSKFGTYLIASKFHLQWNIKINQWEIIGEEITFIKGTTEDKKIEGKYFAFSSPISFVTRK